MFKALLNSAKCCLASIEVTNPDDLGLRFVLLNYAKCLQSNCPDQNFCLSIKRVIETELNNRSEVEFKPLSWAKE